MNNLSKRTKIILAVVLGVIIIWGIYYFGFAKPNSAAAAATKAAAAGAAAAAAGAAAGAAGATGMAM